MKSTLLNSCRASGVCDHYANDDHHALEIARNIVANLNWKQSVCSSLPLPLGDPVFLRHVSQVKLTGDYAEPLFSADEMGGIIPADSKKPFDIRKVPYEYSLPVSHSLPLPPQILARIVDGSVFHEFKPLYGTTLVTGFARLYGMQIGIIANNGILFSESALKVSLSVCPSALLMLSFSLGHTRALTLSSSVLKEMSRFCSSRTSPAS
jgi:3-methylcrotonyl-CoA carboxylase beta subunit